MSRRMIEPEPVYVACPYCGALDGQPCTSPDGRPRSPHGARRAFAVRQGRPWVQPSLFDP